MVRKGILMGEGFFSQGPAQTPLTHDHPLKN